MGIHVYSHDLMLLRHVYTYSVEFKFSPRVVRSLQVHTTRINMRREGGWSRGKGAGRRGRGEGSREKRRGGGRGKGGAMGKEYTRV